MIVVLFPTLRPRPRRNCLASAFWPRRRSLAARFRRIQQRPQLGLVFRIPLVQREQAGYPPTSRCEVAARVISRILAFPTVLAAQLDEADFLHCPQVMKLKSRPVMSTSLVPFGQCEVNLDFSRDQFGPLNPSCGPSAGSSVHKSFSLRSSASVTKPSLTFA